MLYKLIKYLHLNDLSNMNNASRNNLQEQGQPPLLLPWLSFPTVETEQAWTLSSEL